MSSDSTEHTERSVRSRARRSMKWSVLAKAVSQGGTIIGTIILARVLPASDFGLVALAMVYLGFLQQFIDGGLLEALIQRPTLTDQELSSAFWLLLATGAAGFGASCLAKDYIEKLFAIRDVGDVVMTTSAVLLALPFRVVSQSVLSRDIRLDELSKLEALINLCRLSMSLLMAWYGWGVWSIAIPFVVTEITFPILAYSRAGWTVRTTFSWKALRPISRLGVDLTLSRIVGFLGARVDQFLIGRLLGPEALGLYALAWQFAGAAPQFLLATLLRVVFPLFTRVQGDHERLRNLFLEFSRAITYVALPALLGLAVVSPDLIMALLGAKWMGAIVPLQALSLLAYVRIIESLAAVLSNARGTTRQTLAYSLASLIATSAGVSAGISVGGLSGAAILLSIASIPVTLLLVTSILRATGSSLGKWFAAIRKPLLASAAMALVVALVGSLLPPIPLLLRITLMSAIGLITYWYFTRSLAVELIRHFRGPRGN